MRTPIVVGVALLAAIALPGCANQAIAQSSQERNVVAGAALEQGASSALGIYRLWSSPSDSVGQRPFSDYESLLTDRARQARAGYDERRDAALLACAASMPLAMLRSGPIELIQGEATITLRLPAHGIERVIHMNDGRAAASPPPARTPLGQSIGYWDHDVLVIETTNLNEGFFDLHGTPVSDQVQFIERLAVSADDAHLTYKLTTIDRVMFRGPITSERRWDWIPGATIEPAACMPK